MRPGCFISYKSEDSLYKDIILGMDIGAFTRPHDACALCYFCGSPQDVRDEILGCSRVTLYLIGRYSSERLGKAEQRFIKRELQASLCRGRSGLPNGIIGVVLPESLNSVFKGTYICPECNNAHKETVVDDTTVISEFSSNYSPESCKDKSGLCVLASWYDFISSPDSFIEEALRRAGVTAL